MSVTVQYMKSRPFPLEEMRRGYATAHPDSTNDVVYDPFALTQVQTYLPIYDQFFQVTQYNHHQITFDAPRSVSGYNRVYNHTLRQHENVPVHVKFAPILDPVRQLDGKYDAVHNERVPKFDSSRYTSRYAKISSPMNSAYIDAFFCYLVGKLRDEGVENAIAFYGTYSAVQSKFMYDIAGDYQLLSSAEFRRGEGKVYQRVLTASDTLYEEGEEGGEGSASSVGYAASDGSSTCNTVYSDPISRPPLVIGDELGETDFDVVHEEDEFSPQQCYEEEGGDSASGGRSESAWENGSYESANGSDLFNPSLSGWKEGSTDENPDSVLEEEPVNVLIHNMPVQLICMEKCEYTLHYLLSTQTLTEPELQSMIAQIVFTLELYQRRYQFVHNDLHSCNVMYTTTVLTHLEYTVDGTTYRVPTYGRVYKVIDFGRSMFVVDGVRFGSDSFAQHGDARNQYNCAPFYDDSKPTISPNFSFDLCFLGVELSYILPLSPLSEARAVLDEWCKDDTGKNIGYTANGTERYPGFKLYKMITRCVHNHVPRNEINTIPWMPSYIIRRPVDDILEN